MNSLKTIALVAVMAAVGYGVYTSLHKRPPAEPPAGLPENWAAGPQVQLPAVESSTLPVALSPGSAAAPPFMEGAAGTPPTAAGVAASASPAAPIAATPSNPSAATPATAQAVYGTPGAPSAQATIPAGPRGDEGFAVADDRAASLEPGKAVMSAGDIHVQFARAFDAAQVQADTGKLAEAHLDLSQWYDHPELSEGQTRQLVEMLDRLAGTVIYSHRHHLLEKPYQVKPGQSLQQIAEEHQVPWQLLAKINGLTDPAAIRPGDPLKVVRGPFDAVVDARNYRLTLFLQGRYAGRFSIGLGRDTPSGEGDFEVHGVVDNPVYRGADVVVPAGDPGNPIGRIWIDLGNQWGIHGTNDPRSVGTNTGRGCILLKAPDIAHVQDILTVGSRVIVRR